MTRGSCTTCAFCYNTVYGVETQKLNNTQWLGYGVSCYLKIWTLNYNLDNGERILNDAYPRTPGGGTTTLSYDELEKIYQNAAQNTGLAFSKTTVPLQDGKNPDGTWKDLTKYRCRNYLPKNRYHGLSAEECLKEHRRVKKEIKSWVILILTAIIAISTAYTALNS